MGHPAVTRARRERERHREGGGMGVCARRRSQMREMPPRARMVATQLRRGFRKPRGGGGRSGPGSGPGSPGTPDAVPGCWPAAAASGGPSGESSPMISPRSRSCRLSRCTSRCTSRCNSAGGTAHGGSLLLTALTRDAAHAAVATKLMGSVGITNGSTGGTTSRSDSPDSRFGDGGSDCAFDVRSGLGD